MRTEDDLRTALTALERHAPPVERVLAASKRHSSHGLRSPKAIRRLAVITTAAAVAGVVTALSLPAGPSTSIPNESATPHSSPPNDTTLRAKLVAAFSAASGYIVYESSTSLNTGKSPIVVEGWSYPSQPRPGQLVRTRTVTYNMSGTLHTEEADIFVMPPIPRTIPSLGGIPANGERIIVDYVGKTWSDQKDTPLPGGVSVSSERVLYDIKTAHWTANSTTLNGRAALELSFRETDKSNPSTVHLWVDAATYLPLRETDVFGPPGMTNNTTINDEYLPPTSANLAKLTAPIPAGFRQVTQNPSGARNVEVTPKAVVTPSAN